MALRLLVGGPLVSAALFGLACGGVVFAVSYAVADRKRRRELRRGREPSD